MRVNIVLSETWLKADLQLMKAILNQAIEDFVEERIINIESKTESDGLSRFWIYTMKDRTR
jgi:hypothetical protein